MGSTFYFNFEVELMTWIQSFMGTALTAAASFFTICGEEALLVGILGFLYWVYDKKAAQYIGLNIIAGIVFTPLLKNLALRRRPYFDHEAIRCLKPVHSGDIYDISAQGFSFPSGHSTNSVIMYGSLPLIRRNVKPETGLQKASFLYKKSFVLTAIGIVMPLLIGLSRIALGVHYPTDVLSGWILGTVILFALSYIQGKTQKRGILYVALLLMCLPGMFYCKTNDYYTCYGVMAGYFLANTIEERYIKFESTRNVPAALLRLVAGMGLYYALNTVCKLPFSAEFLTSGTSAAYMVRCARYFLVSFLMLGLYPLSFKTVEAKLFKK